MPLIGYKSVSQGSEVTRIDSARGPVLNCQALRVLKSKAFTLLELAVFSNNNRSC